MLVGAAAAAFLLSLGCRQEEKQVEGSSESKPKPKPKLLLYCGAGIRLAVSEIVDEFEKEHDVTIETDYAGSNILLSRIKLTKKGDLYMPGDVRYVEQAEEEGLIASSRDACYFIPVILVPKGNPKNIRAVADLLKERVRIGFGDTKACAIGRVTTEILKRNGLNPDEVEKNVVFRSLTVNELGVHIKAGRIDATIVWDAIAAQYPDEGEIIVIPKEKNVISTIPIAVLRSSEHPRVAAVFQKFVLSEEGRAIFAKHHYTIEAPR